LEARLLELLQHPQIRALGEIGLDYHYTLSPVDVQKTVFERQATIAVEKQLPITIHTRDAEADTLEILEKVIPRDHFFHIHCFTGSWEFAAKVLERWPNSYFGFTGVLTFKNSKDIQSVCARVPMDRILSETDGPYMAPIPFRGKPAWPGHIPIIIKKMAELHNISEDEAFEAIRENGRRIYRF
jgi:TatD DNase family protein